MTNVETECGEVLLMTTEQRSFARHLRKTNTTAEDLLWQHLRNRKFRGLKFRRQVPMLNYTVDFLCSDAKLIIELDGNGHADRPDYDAERTREIESQGYRVLRFSNEVVLNDLDAVFSTVSTAADTSRQSPSPPTPLPSGRGEQSAP
jgi:very-short-patch-repair endonuclease